MSLLKTTCEQCGEIELPVERVLLRICEDDDRGVCVIRCPSCGRRFVKEANDAMIVMLLAVGIEVSMWSSALTGSGSSGAASGDLGAITHQELADFGRRLGDEADLLRHLEPQS
jgi:4-hydroxy-3-methylbut-2-en-1-yl diphosphate synthase IspG/GcpE